MISVCKKFSFCYGHRLPEYEGKCSRFHGHNSEVEVEVTRNSGEPSYPTMVIDFGELKELVNPILEKLDHFDLTEFFQGPPTAETICRYIANAILSGLPKGVQLVRVKVTETPTSWAEWKVEVW